LDLAFSGLFPLEAPPLTPSWALKLMSFKKRFLMSKFGEDALHAVGISADFVPLPVADIWAPPVNGQREKVRGEVGIKDFTLLTVAENQERKNLSAAAEIVSKLPHAKWILVTRAKATYGWNISDLLNTYGINDRTLVVEKG